jgi:hypothetical protein
MRSRFLLAVAFMILLPVISPHSQERRSGTLSMDHLTEVIRDGRIRTEALQPFFDYGGATAYAFEVPGAEAIAWWNALRSIHQSSGYWPIIIGSPDAADLVLEYRDYALQDFYSSPDPAVAVPGYDLSRWRDRRISDYREWLPDPHGPWPAATSAREQAPPNLLDAPQYAYAVHTWTGPEPLPAVCIALLPVDNAWESPLPLCFGGWNECPEPMVQAATFRQWQEDYGAVPVALTYDTAELFVSEPVRDRDSALQLAYEYYLYCGDSVWQGFPTLEQLAAALINEQHWFFWWD